MFHKNWFSMLFCQDKECKMSLGLVEKLQFWLKVSEITTSNTYIGTRPTISDVKKMLAEADELVKQRDALLKACEDIYNYDEARRKAASNAPLPNSVVGEIAKKALGLCEKEANSQTNS